MERSDFGLFLLDAYGNDSSFECGYFAKAGKPLIGFVGANLRFPQRLDGEAHLAAIITTDALIRDTLAEDEFFNRKPIRLIDDYKGLGETVRDLVEGGYLQPERSRQGSRSSTEQTRPNPVSDTSPAAGDTAKGSPEAQAAEYARYLGAAFVGLFQQRLDILKVVDPSAEPDVYSRLWWRLLKDYANDDSGFLGKLWKTAGSSIIGRRRTASVAQANGLSLRPPSTILAAKFPAPTYLRREVVPP